MSLWTPSGEHPVGDRRPAPGPGGGPQDRPPQDPPGAPEDPPGAPQVDELRRQLADAPADVVVANHCYGLFELAAVYLSQSPPHLDRAQLAIDALGLVVDGLGERLGPASPELRDALAQIRLAFVQIQAATTHAAPDGAADHDGAAAPDGGPATGPGGH